MNAQRRSARFPRRELRIAMLAPPWIPVPPPAYGGIESVVALLTDELVRRGHDVTLFAAPGSRSLATVRPLLDRHHPDHIGHAVYEADHVARAFAAIDAAAQRGRPFDVVHDHCGAVAIAMAERLATPLVHTLHGPFTGDQSSFYAEHGPKATLVAISDAQRRDAPPNARASCVIPNPIAVRDWPLRTVKDDFLLWIGRMTTEKGPQRAITAARAARRRLIIAGPIQPGQDAFFASEVEPHIDGRNVLYVGEVGGYAKQALFASAAALLVPIRWAEPFGMVMVEALACGTPVIAFDQASAGEIVVDGKTGFLVDDESGMASAVRRLSEIDPRACRESAEQRFDGSAIAAEYEGVYLAAAGRARQAEGHLARIVGRSAQAPEHGIEVP